MLRFSQFWILNQWRLSANTYYFLYIHSLSSSVLSFGVSGIYSLKMGLQQKTMLHLNQCRYAYIRSIFHYICRKILCEFSNIGFWDWDYSLVFQFKPRCWTHGQLVNQAIQLVNVNHSPMKLLLNLLSFTTCLHSGLIFWHGLTFQEFILLLLTNFFDTLPLWWSFFFKLGEHSDHF